jgi:phospholipase C
LYVVCSDANAVAAVDLTEPRSHVLGFVPTGWYPTAARVLGDDRLLVINGRGLRSFPNPGGPNPTRRTAPVHLGGTNIEYVARIQTGTASVIDPITEDQLDAYTRTVQSNSPYRDEFLDRVDIPQGNPVPSTPGAASPIEHVIYIVRENRTYDQVLGDLGKGNSDPSLTLFGENVTPNAHKLAREFVLFDNFYVNADVSADGHNWSTSAIANDYVQKMWPNSYAARRKHYDYEGGEPAALPPAGYLWTNANAKGITMRNYGWWAGNLPTPAPDGKQIASVRDPILARVTNMNYRAFDLEYLDVDRIKVFLADLAQFETSGTMPQLILVRIGNDHTSGTAPGRRAPLALVADNDEALGMLVEAVSKSKFWASTAIFVLEDDAQNGPDHVDSHRSPAFIISPYTRRGTIDSNMYNTTSMLRTMELILGLRPMTHFDAAARPMFAAFANTPDVKPFTAEKPRIPTTDRNPAANPTAARSREMDFSEADRIDDDELNDVLWRAVRKTEPPAPVRSYFSRR